MLEKVLRYSKKNLDFPHQFLTEKLEKIITKNIITYV